jgi:hypothetical protein
MTNLRRPCRRAAALLPSGALIHLAVSNEEPGRISS